LSTITEGNTIRTFADHLGRITKSVLVRESLEAALRRRPRRAASCYGLARDLAGTVKGLPRDLAHNPKYMEGFGE
jgi:hypothetical protein